MSTVASTRPASTSGSSTGRRFPARTSASTRPAVSARPIDVTVAVATDVPEAAVALVAATSSAPPTTSHSSRRRDSRSWPPRAPT